MNLVSKLLRLFGSTLSEIVQLIRRILFFILSTGFKGRLSRQPILIRGRGKLQIGKGVEVGVPTSPFYLTSYCYLEPRNCDAVIAIGDNVKINNNFYAIANESSISIGKNTLIGLNVGIVDSDFHRVAPEKRGNNDARSIPVNIGENVFIGNDVKIYKGVSVGDGAVIGAGAIVFDNVAANSIVKGNPARLVEKA